MVLGKQVTGRLGGMDTGCNQKDEYTKSLLENFGMEVTRHFFEMEIEFDGPPEEPVIPEGILIRPYAGESEVETVAQAYLDSFQDHFGFVEMPIEKLIEMVRFMIAKDPNYDPDLWCLAMDGDDVAGLLIGVPRTAEDPEMGYVNILGVCRPWRRRGLGLALLQLSFVEFYKRGSKRASLGVDASSLTGATRLYEKAGMHVNRRYDNYEKVLRDGQDLRRTSL